MAPRWRAGSPHTGRRGRGGPAGRIGSPRAGGSSPPGELFAEPRGIAARTGTPGSARVVTARSSSIAGSRTSCSTSSSGCTREGTLHGDLRGARRGRFGDAGADLVVIDPIDGSLNARRTLPSFAQRRRRQGLDRWPTSSSGTSTTSAPARSSPARQRRHARRRTELAPRARFGLEVVGLEAAKPELILPIVEGCRARPIGAGGRLARDLPLLRRRRPVRRHAQRPRTAAPSTSPPPS